MVTIQNKIVPLTVKKHHFNTLQDAQNAYNNLIDAINKPFIYNVDLNFTQLQTQINAVNWIEVVGGVGFKNSWNNYDPVNWETAAYYKDVTGRVYMKGLVSNGTVNTAIFTLPIGYRPSKNCIFAISNSAVFDTLYVQSDGKVLVKVGGNSYININVNFSIK